MGTSSIEELTVSYTEDNVETMKELDKVILSKGAWTTIMFRLQNLDRKTGEYGPDKYAIRRYQKRNNEYMLKSKFNISSKDQARKIIDVLEAWVSL